MFEFDGPCYSCHGLKCLFFQMFSADDIRLFKNVSECGDRIFLKQLCTRINKEVDSTSALKLQKLKTEEELTTLIREAETEQTKGKCKVIKHC